MEVDEVIALLDDLPGDGVRGPFGLGAVWPPGYMRFMFLPSTGLRCGTILANDGTLSSGTTITVPDSVDASTVAGSFSSAMIDAYSVPCAPASSASTGPGLAPLTTITGIDSAASLPAGTSMAPAAVWPGAALAVPTTNGACSAAHRLVEAAIVNRTHPNTRIGVMAPPIGSDGGDVGHCQGREAILAGKSVIPMGEIARSDPRIRL